MFLAVPLGVLGAALGFATRNAFSSEPPTGSAADLQCLGDMYFKGNRLFTEDQLQDRTFDTAQEAASAFLAEYQEAGRQDGKPVADNASIATAMRASGLVFGLVTDNRLDFAAEVTPIGNGFAVLGWAFCAEATPNAEIDGRRSS